MERETTCSDGCTCRGGHDIGAGVAEPLADTVARIIATTRGDYDAAQVHGHDHHDCTDPDCVDNDIDLIASARANHPAGSGFVPRSDD